MPTTTANDIIFHAQKFSLRTSFALRCCGVLLPKDMLHKRGFISGTLHTLFEKIYTLMH